MNKKIAFLCRGCGLDESLDFNSLINILNKNDIKNVKEIEALCSSEGLDIIRRETNNGIDKILIGACSSRVMTDKFDINDIIVERCALREQVLWCSFVNDNTEKINRQMLAEDYIRMSSIKLAKAEKNIPYKLEGPVAKSILIIGGGAAGMNAALILGEINREVHLIERERFLGGFMTKMYKLIPQTNPYKNLEESNLEELITKINNNTNIKIYTNTTVNEINGSPGNFTVKLNTGDSIHIGAIIQATGWTPYDPNNLSKELSYSSNVKIVTNIEFEQMAKDNKLMGIEKIAFIQCAGSRDENHLPYCSSFCCSVSCKQAIYTKIINPESSVYVIYKDIRTPSQSEEVYREAQRQGVIFIRRDEKYPAISGNNKLSLETMDVQLNEKIKIEDLDLIVLAIGIKSNNPTMLDLPLAAYGENQEAIKELTEKIKIQNDDWSILNLQYRQGPNLPTLKYGMPDSHFICFPYETRRTGIYTAGAVRRPMRLIQAQDDGIGAAMKAIQAIQAVEGGYAIHPRLRDESYPEFAMQRCTQCKRCTEECPFGAINEDEKFNPLPNPTRCRRCGICMGACPERIISFKNFSIDMIGSMIKGIDVPEEDEEKPRIIAFICENDALPAIDMAAKNGYKWSSYIRFLPIRCLGSINLVWIADALANGIDGIMLLGCRRGDNYQCHFIKGSELANVRMSKISETLTRLVLEADRVQVIELSIDEIDRIPHLLDNFVEIIKSVGPNPYKGF